MKGVERFFERALWNSRLIVIVAVVASLVVALVMFYIATADSVFLVAEARHYVDPGNTAARQHLHLATVARVAEIVDGYLFATIMIIFALGLYELFIGKIEAAERSPTTARLLQIDNIDDLKERLAKVVFLILIVRYFEFALEAPIASALDLLYLAIGIALIALSLFLTRSPAHKGGRQD